MKNSRPYSAPLKDFEFLLVDVLRMSRFSGVERLSLASPDISSALLEGAARFVESEIAPRNRQWDVQGCTLVGHDVRTPETFSQAYRRYIDGGWPALTGAPACGGHGLPSALGACFAEMLSSASMAFSITPILNAASHSVFEGHATAAVRETWLSAIVRGDAAVSMQMTEAHCGTDIGLIKTVAAPVEDGSYRLTGTKIWISGGEHDLTDNIVHLVLARIVGAPKGLDGVSLFVVPKFLINTDGSRGARNPIYCTGIESKMGNHANPTCFMSHEASVGYLVGSPNRGLAAMFAMMNAVRLGVGIQGVGVAEAAYQRALSWSKSRLQGRSLDDATATRFGDGPQPILVHPDVRRILLETRCIVEAGRFLNLRTAVAIDLASSLSDPSVAGEYKARAALMTPMLKAFFSDFGLTAATDAQQLFGGAGYACDTGMEQLVRDARLGMIYEGANGIQALDLVRRKLIADQGDAMFSFIASSKTNVLDQDGRLAKLKTQFIGALSEFEETTGILIREGTANPELAAAASMPYLRLFAYIAMAEAWLLMASRAFTCLDDDNADADFYEDKLIYASFYYEQILPTASSLSIRVRSGCGSLLSWPACFSTAN